MAKPVDKKATLKGAKGPPGLHSFTVLFFEGRLSYMDLPTTADAASLNLSSATAKYVETAPGDWSLCLVFRPRVGKAIKVARPLMSESLRPEELLEVFLAKELMVQARLASQELQDALQDRTTGPLALGIEQTGG